MTKAPQQIEPADATRTSRDPLGGCDAELQRALGLATRSGDSPRESLHVFSDELTRWLPHHHVDIVVLTPDAQDFFYLGAAFRDPPYPSHDESATPSLWSGYEEGKRYSLSDFTIRHVVDTAEALRIEHYPSDARALDTNNPSELHTFRGGLEHGLMLPLVLDDDVFGVMCCGRGKPHEPFSDGELAFAMGVAQRVAPFAQMFRAYRLERELREKAERQRDVAERLNAFARAVRGSEDAHEILAAFAREVLEPYEATPWREVAVRLLAAGDDGPVARTLVTTGDGRWRFAGEQPVAGAADRAVLLGEAPSLVAPGPDATHVVLTVPLRARSRIVGSLSFTGADELASAASANVALLLADNLAPHLDAVLHPHGAGRRSREDVEAIHDAIVQDLVAAPGVLPDDADSVEALLERAIGHSRELLRGLGTLEPTQGRLAALIEAEARAAGEALGADVDVRVDVEDDCVAPAQTFALYAIAKPLLTNVRSHSRARSLSVRLSLGEGQYRLAVTDDGVGMAPGIRERDAWSDGGTELFLVRERVRLAGGEVTFRSEPEKGTAIEVVLPAQRPSRADASLRLTLSQAEPLVIDALDEKLTSVLLIDGHQVVREGLRRMLGRALGFTVVGEAVDGATGVRLTAAARPDVVIVDLQLRHRPGVDAIRAIVEGSPSTRILATSAFDDADAAQQALAAGADAFVSKSAPGSDLLRTLRALCEPNGSGGEAPMPRIHLRPHVADTAAQPKLTVRELEILRLITTDLTYRAIGATLFISEKTVQYHVSHLFTKLGVRSRAAAVSRAGELGLLSIAARGPSNARTPA